MRRAGIIQLSEAVGKESKILRSTDACLRPHRRIFEFHAQVVAEEV